MDTIVIFSMLISAFLHAFWNYLLKRSREPSLFIALSKVLEAIIFFAPFLYFQQHYPLSVQQIGVVSIAALLVLASYFFLALAYRFLDMSIAYPVSRSSTLFLPFLAWFFLDEGISTIGLIAIALITIGVILLSLGGMKAVTNNTSTLPIKGILLALAVAFISGLQTIWSKLAIMEIHPFVFFYSYTFLVGVGYCIYLLIRYPKKAIRSQLTMHWPAISYVAILNTCSYGLFLYALSRASAAYVGSIRQLSLVIALMLGYWLLKETLSKQKLLGTAIVIAGTLLITFVG